MARKQVSEDYDGGDTPSSSPSADVIRDAHPSYAPAHPMKTYVGRLRPKLKDLPPVERPSTHILSPMARLEVTPVLRFGPYEVQNSLLDKIPCGSIAPFAHALAGEHAGTALEVPVAAPALPDGERDRRRARLLLAHLHTHADAQSLGDLAEAGDCSA